MVQKCSQCHFATWRSQPQEIDELGKRGEDVSRIDTFESVQQTVTVPVAKDPRLVQICGSMGHVHNTPQGNLPTKSDRSKGTKSVVALQQADVVITCYYYKICFC